MTEILNKKTGNKANLLETYNRTSDNQKMHVVMTGYGKAYWLAKNCEEVK